MDKERSPATSSDPLSNKLSTVQHVFSDSKGLANATVRPLYSSRLGTTKAAAPTSGSHSPTTR